jgi:hypothetical protein
VACDDHAVGPERVAGAHDGPEIPGIARPVEHEGEQVVADRDTRDVGVGHAHDGQQLRAVGAAAESRHQRRRQLVPPLRRGAPDHVGGPARQRRAGDLHDRVDRPGVIEGTGDRQHPFHEKRARAVTRGSVAREALEHLKRRVLGADLQPARAVHLRLA